VNKALKFKIKNTTIKSSKNQYIKLFVQQLAQKSLIKKTIRSRLELKIFFSLISNHKIKLTLRYVKQDEKLFSRNVQRPFTNSLHRIGLKAKQIRFK